jgi:hypothetical protein
VREGITCFDPAAALAAACHRTGRSQYFPGGDMHWNADGHRAVFEALREGVRGLASKMTAMIRCEEGAAFRPSRRTHVDKTREGVSR